MIAEQIKNEAIASMRARDEMRTRVLRGLLAAFTNELVAQKKKPSEMVPDTLALTVIKRALKQREDSIEQFEKGGRQDLVENERAELEILKTYLPETMGKDEILKVAEKKKEEFGITDKSGMGRLIGQVMSELKDKADGKDVKEVVESLFD